jgi:hypothetical protein
MDTLHKQAMEIAVVETRLAALRQEYNRLREELSPYIDTTMQIDSVKVTLPSTNVTIAAPIHCCPQDILYMIFDFSLARDHQQIRTLLLVCKDWYYFVMNSPKLWTRLQIMDAYDLFDLKTRRSKESYILACMKRCCNLKLDVRLDLQNFPDQFSLAREEITTCALDVLPKAQHQQFRELFDDGSVYFTSKHYTTQMEQALERLVGPQGKHLERWGMLSLILPTTSFDDIRERIWRSLVNVTPNLAAFEIRNPPESWDGVFPGLPEALYPDLSAAKKVILHIAKPISCFHLSPTVLERLVIKFKSLSNLNELNHLTRLRQLHLYGQVDLTPPQTDSISITLPRLRRLILSGHYKSLVLVKFELPKLENLTLRFNEALPPLPEVSPQEIDCDCYAISGSEDILQNNINGLDTLLYSYPAIRTLTIRKPLQAAALNVIATRKAMKKLPNLTRLVIKEDGSWLHV